MVTFPPLITYLILQYLNVISTLLKCLINVYFLLNRCRLPRFATNLTPIRTISLVNSPAEQLRISCQNFKGIYFVAVSWKLVLNSKLPTCQIFIWISNLPSFEFPVLLLFLISLNFCIWVQSIIFCRV